MRKRRAVNYQEDGKERDEETILNFAYILLCRTVNIPIVTENIKAFLLYVTATKERDGETTLNNFAYILLCRTVYIPIVTEDVKAFLLQVTTTSY